MKKVLLVIGGITAYSLTELGLLYFCDRFYRGSDLYVPAQNLSLLISSGLMVAVLILYRVVTRQRWINTEAQHWLAQRSDGRLKPIYARRQRLWRRVLWVPSLIALAVTLFFPEVIGVSTHLFYRGPLRLYHFRVEIPGTWIIVDGEFDERNPRSYVETLVGKGIARAGPALYWHGRAPISATFFSVIPDDLTSDDAHDYEPPKDSTVVGKQTLTFGTDFITCWDTLPDLQQRYYIRDVGASVIDCEAPKSHFHASFYGLPDDVPTFYAVLQRVVKTE